VRRMEQEAPHGYEVEVRGRIGASQLRLFEPWAVHGIDGSTTILMPHAPREALHGLLLRLDDFPLELLQVRPMSADAAAELEAPLPEPPSDATVVLWAAEADDLSTSTTGHDLAMSEPVFREALEEVLTQGLVVPDGERYVLTAAGREAVGDLDVPSAPAEPSLVERVRTLLSRARKAPARRPRG
jgi:hypothetical protein